MSVCVPVSFCVPVTFCIPVRVFLLRVWYCVCLCITVCVYVKGKCTPQNRYFAGRSSVPLNTLFSLPSSNTSEGSKQVRGTRGEGHREANE